MKAEYHDNEKEYLDYYDEVEVYAESSEALPKSAIQVRNRSMIDRSDLVVSCIQHKSGGAYRTIQYAEKQGKKIVNLADEKGIGFWKENKVIPMRCQVSPLFVIIMIILVGRYCYGFRVTIWNGDSYRLSP